MKKQFKKAVLFVNGEMRDARAVQKTLTGEELLVGVDGGTRHLLNLGYFPHLVIGDLDSLSRQQLGLLAREGVTIHQYPAEKDETDLELALQETHQMGIREIVIIAALGGRLDQTLGNLLLLTSPDYQDCLIRLFDGEEEVFIIRHDGEIHGRAGDVISLIPLSRCVQGVKTEGLKYPLKGETLWMDRSRGISNEMLIDHACVCVEDGLLLCLHRWHKPVDGGTSEGGV